jgi:hypothetical protein
MQNESHANPATPVPSSTSDVENGSLEDNGLHVSIVAAGTRGVLQHVLQLAQHLPEPTRLYGIGPRRKAEGGLEGWHGYLMSDGSAIVVKYDGSEHITIKANDVVDHIYDEFADDEDTIRCVIDEVTATIATALRK